MITVRFPTGMCYAYPDANEVWPMPSGEQHVMQVEPKPEVIQANIQQDRLAFFSLFRKQQELIIPLSPMRKSQLIAIIPAGTPCIIEIGEVNVCPGITSASTQG